MDKGNGSVQLDLDEKKNANSTSLPVNGAILIDGKTATSVSFQRSDDAGEARFDVTYKLANRVVQKEQGLTDTQLESAVGEVNAQRIKNDTQPRGTLRGEALVYTNAISPAEIANRVKEAAEQSVAGFGEEAVERASQQRARDRAALNIKVEPNEIVDMSPRSRSTAQHAEDVGQSSLSQPSIVQRQIDTRAEPHGAVEVEADQLAARIKDALNKRYIEGDKAFHFRHGGHVDDVAFSHTHSKIISTHSNADVVRDMVALSVAKGWTEIKLKGSEDFKREAWLEASLYGLKVDGYKPRDVDVIRLDELRADETRRVSSVGGVSRNEIQKAADVREHAPLDAPVVQRRRDDRDSDVNSKAANSQEHKPSVIGELQHIMRARGDSETAIGMAVAVASERLERHQNAVVGILKDHGHARYENMPDEKPSYYVTLETRAGQKTVWGIDLERALANSDVKTGQVIALENLGRKEVIVEENVRDEAGSIVGSRKLNAHRNEWDVIVIDRAKAEVREQLHLIEARQGMRPTLPEGYQRNPGHVHRPQQDVNRVELDREIH
jgi:hypothetical protein